MNLNSGFLAQVSSLGVLYPTRGPVNTNYERVRRIKLGNNSCNRKRKPTVVFLFLYSFDHLIQGETKLMSPFAFTVYPFTVYRLPSPSFKSCTKILIHDLFLSDERIEHGDKSLYAMHCLHTH